MRWLLRFLKRSIIDNIDLVIDTDKEVGEYIVKVYFMDVLVVVKRIPMW